MRRSFVHALRACELRGKAVADCRKLVLYRGAAGKHAARLRKLEITLPQNIIVVVVVEVANGAVHVEQHVYLGDPLRRVEPDRQVHVVFVLHRARADVRQIQRERGSCGRRRVAGPVGRNDILHRAARNGRREREVDTGGGQRLAVRVRAGRPAPERRYAEYCLRRAYGSRACIAPEAVTAVRPGRD